MILILRGMYRAMLLHRLEKLMETYLASGEASCDDKIIRVSQKIDAIDASIFRKKLARATAA